ncbi:putative disease resistance protein RGA3 [Ziziphus jujuba]|uniref:Disease resistance protein RGA3 n=1 Tax=Ziziphus jujuba TaxID=326968 RepID=A0ABM3IJG1_ZIZJJ|nr:putative disease resistance protein RGA3 [Ziziphus jujuba]
MDLVQPDIVLDFCHQKEKGDIKQLLLKDRDNGEDQHHLAVVAIVGYGGLGKTRLAQYMFIKSSEFKKRFKMRAWVHVPYDDFNIGLLVQRIIDCNNLVAKPEVQMIGEQCIKPTKHPDHLDELYKELRKVISGNRLLLVLDDVWNMDSEMRKEFKGLFSDAGPGSRILITTRSKFVANNVTSRTEDVYTLSNLYGSYSWKLFKNRAGIEYKHISSEIEEIGKEIMEMCGGNPLAIATEGGKLQSINLETKDWSDFRDAGFHKVMNEEVLPLLKLSYNVLPQHLKHCFAYCGVFPRQSEIDVKTLIHLWMAQGLICPLRGQRAEDVGYEYFQDLFQTSLFEAVEVDPENGSVTKCKMPKLLQDLAVQIAGGMTKRLVAFNQYEKHGIDGRTQHVSSYFHLGSSWKIPTSFLQAKRIRTFVLPSQLHWETEGRLSHTTFETIVSNCKGLRALDLHNTGIQKVPKSIDKLKYLRYLDLSQNSAITSLPNSITNIPYLMTLKLSSCYGLEELPRDMKKLVHLKHLENDWCYSLTYMPPGLGQLTQLETLSEFVVKNDTELKELAVLNELRGELKIQNLRNDMDSGVAKLEGKKHLKSLILAWEVNNDSEQGAEGTLQGLKPHSNLKELALFGSSTFPAWLILLRNLVNQLPSLKVLTVEEMDNLEYISHESRQFLSSSSTAAFMPSLEELRLKELPNLEGWWQEEHPTSSLPPFGGRKRLVIEDCPKLRSMPLYPNLEEWLVLDNTSLETFIQTMNDGSSSEYCWG